MAPHQIIGMALRQAPGQHLEALSAIPGAGNDDPGVDRDAPLILGRRNKPGGIGVAWMGGDGKAEFRRADRRELVPVGAAIGGAEDAVMVLAPDDIGVGPAMRETVNVLG